MRSAVVTLAVLLTMPASAQAQSKTWGTAVRIMLARDAELAGTAATVKRVCGIDAADSIDSLTMNAPDPRTGTPSGVVVIGLAGVDEPRLRDCAGKYGRASGKPVILRKGPDGITEVSHQGDSLLVVFVKPRVMAVALDPADRPVLVAMLGRRPAGAAGVGAAAGSATLPPSRTARAIGKLERRLRELVALAQLVRDGALQGLTAEITISLESGEQQVRDLLDDLF